jgi:hypothetical protein
MQNVLNILVILSLAVQNVFAVLKPAALMFNRREMPKLRPSCQEQ